MRHLNILLPLILLLTPLTTISAQFSDVSSERGIDFLYEHSLYMGGGCTFFDYDNDGDDDLYLVGGMAPDRLYKNNGNGHFTDVSEELNILSITEPYKTNGAVTGDIDNDGWREIFVYTHHLVEADTIVPTPNLLLRWNETTGKYQNIAPEMGITDSSFTMSATFGDVNKDGLLDLYVANYIETPMLLFENPNIPNQPTGYDHTCINNILYINDMESNFNNVTSEWGVGDKGCALATAFSDYDQDNDMDIMLANDFGEWLAPNRLFENQYPETGFVEVGEETQTDLQMYAMGIAIGDYDLDEDWDYYITNLGKNAFLRQNNDGIFTEIAEELNIDDTYTQGDSLLTTGWGTVFFDYDNDFYSDLFVANGWVGSLDFNETDKIDPDHFYKNTGGNFEEIFVGLNDAGTSRGAAVSDIDNDGDVDLAVSVLFNFSDTTVSNPHIMLYDNQTENNYNYLKIKLVGTQTNRDAFGCMVKVFVGDKVLMREVGGGSSHCSQNSSVLHFGLNTEEKVDSVVVFWLNSPPQTLTNVSANQTLEIVEGEDYLWNNEVVFNKNIKIFPNPCTDYLNIDFSEKIKQITIFNTNGQVIKSLPNPISLLDVSDLLSGKYFLQVTTEKEIFYRDFLKIE